MFAKIFTQIFDSSIADNWQIRHVFEDLLKLADKDGIVDMTPEAICARTRLPKRMVEEGLKALSEPDPRSRTKDEDGRRIVPIDPGRDWGWKIVNHGKYRAIKTDFDRTAYMRDYMRERRSQLDSVKLESNESLTSASVSTSVLRSGRECEGNQTNHRRTISRRPLSLAEVVQNGQFIGMTEEECVSWYNDCEACDWARGDGSPFDHWRRQQIIHRDKLRSSRGGSHSKAPSISDIRTVIGFKEEKAKAIKERYSVEGPTSTDWTDMKKKKEFFELKKEIKSLKEKAERMLT